MHPDLARALAALALASLAACKLELDAPPSTFVYPSLLAAPGPSAVFWPADPEATRFRYVVSVSERGLEWENEDGDTGLPLEEPLVGEDALAFTAAVVLLPAGASEGVRARGEALRTELLGARPELATSVVPVTPEAFGAELCALESDAAIVEAMRRAGEAHRGARPRSLGDHMGEEFWQPTWFVVPLDGPARGEAQELEYALLNGRDPAEGGRPDALVGFDELALVLPRPTDVEQPPPMRFWVLVPESFGPLARERAARVMTWSATLDDPLLYRVLSPIRAPLASDAELAQIADALWQMGDPVPHLTGTQQYHISFRLPVAGIPPDVVRVPR